MRIKSLVIAIAGLALASCASSGIAPISSGERFAASTEVTEQYKLAPGDKVRITVFNEPQLNGEYSVGAEGDLSLPLIGSIVAVGKTPTETSAMIQSRFAAGYLRDPRITLEVTTYRPFFILGEVRTPGQYPYSSGLTVVNAIATAEGFTARAKKNVVLIRRFGEQAELPYVLTPDLRVWPGDTIRLAERYF